MGIKLYRQNGQSSEYVLIKEFNAEQVSQNETPILVTGIDYVPNCGTVYNYKVSAYNSRGRNRMYKPFVFLG